MPGITLLLLGTYQSCEGYREKYISNYRITSVLKAETDIIANITNKFDRTSCDNVCRDLQTGRYYLYR
jgi:hypothetical protein